MTRTTTHGSLGRAILIGAGAGAIASLVTDDSNLMKSMTADQMSGDAFTFLFGPAMLGAMIHMMTGAMYGAVFGVIAARLRLGLAGLAGVGMAFGSLVFAMSAYIGLPLAASILDSGDSIKNMPEMAGWGTFIIEHLMYGVAAGALVALGLTRSSASLPAGAVATRR